MSGDLGELASRPRERLSESVAAFLLSGEIDSAEGRARFLERHPDGSESLGRFLDEIAARDASVRSDRLEDDPPRLDPKRLATGDIVRPSMDARLAGGFEIVTSIGEGGSGVVYEAKLPHEVAGRPEIALKFLGDGVSLDASRRLRDSQLLKGLRHPNLARVYAAGECHGFGPFVATEYVKGCNLREWLEIHGALSTVQAATAICVLARALHAAHDQDVIHCDVKPANVFGCVGPSLDPTALKIGDFGLARFVSEIKVPTSNRVSRTLAGTIGYMAPEQFWGECDRRADIYALGMTLLSAITTGEQGHAHPLSRSRLECLRSLMIGDEDVPFEFRREKVLATFRANGVEDLVATVWESRKDLHGSYRNRQLRTILAKCLSLEPGERYPTAADLAEDLDRWLKVMPIRHAHRAYGLTERFRMLVDRCRKHPDIEDHTRLWGIICLVIGPLSILTAGACTVLVCLGHDPNSTRTWTFSSFAVPSAILMIWAAWLTGVSRKGRTSDETIRGSKIDAISPTLQLTGVMLTYLVSGAILRIGIAGNGHLADAIQFLLAGITLTFTGLSSRHWLFFLVSGVAVIGMAWPVAIALRQPWLQAFGPALVGCGGGLILVSFGISYVMSESGILDDQNAR